MEISELIPHIEALVFASDKPLTTVEITELINQTFGLEEDKVLVEQVDAAVGGIVEKYSAEFYPFEVRQSGGGWQFLTKKEFHKTVAQLNGEKFLKRLSAAAMETLAIIAYKQPVTKGEIEAIRGVSSDYAVQKLLEKELVVITGRNEALPGHPLVYATSKSFMDYFGVNSPEDLPKIKEVLADQIIAPTVVNHTQFEQSETLAVSDNGELVLADDAQLPVEDPDADGNNIEALSGEESSAQQTENASETLEDERVEEDFITDEIFAAEDKVADETEVKDLPADDVSDTSNQTNGEDEDSSTNEEDKNS